MARRKEIKFRYRCGELVGRQNEMQFFIRTGPGVPNANAPDYWVTVDPGQKRPWLTTANHRYFDLGRAKEFCQKIAAGEIKLEGLLAEFAAEDMAKEQAAIREAAERAKEFRTRLDAKGLKYTDLLELEVMAHSLGDVGHNILLRYERGEGWPSGT